MAQSNTRASQGTHNGGLFGVCRWIRVRLTLSCTTLYRLAQLTRAQSSNEQQSQGFPAKLAVPNEIQTRIIAVKVPGRFNLLKQCNTDGSQKHLQCAFGTMIGP